MRFRIDTEHFGGQKQQQIGTTTRHWPLKRSPFHLNCSLWQTIMIPRARMSLSICWEQQHRVLPSWKVATITTFATHNDIIYFVFSCSFFSFVRSVFLVNSFGIDVFDSTVAAGYPGRSRESVDNSYSCTLKMMRLWDTLHSNSGF